MIPGQLVCTAGFQKIPANVSALLCALRLHEPDAEPLRTLNDDDWEDLLSFCNLSNLTFSLLRIERGLIPSWVEERLAVNARDNSTRFAQIKATYCEIAEALEKEQIDCVVLKGFAQCPEYIEKPQLRPQSDIDLYVPHDQLDGARSALESLRYKPDMAFYNPRADHLPAMVRETGWRWRGNPFDPEMPPAVELHFCLWNERTSLLATPGIDAFWNRRVRREVDGIQFVALSSADNLAYSSLHLLRNLLAGEWTIRQAYELANFLDSHASAVEFWEEWSEVHEPSLRQLEAIGFFIARQWLNCEVSSQVNGEILALPPAIRTWLQEFSESALEVMFHPNKDRVWLHMCLLDGLPARLSLARRTLLPSRIPPMAVAAVNVNSNYRRPRTFVSAFAPLNYLLYCASRVVAHTLPLPAMLWNGLRWWLSIKQLSAEFWKFLGASFFFDLGLSMYFFLFNIYLLSCGFTEKRIGLLTSAMAVGSIAGAFPAGRLAKSLGLRRALLACFILATAIFALRALLVSNPFDLVLSVLAGMTLSIWAVCISPTVAQLTTESNRPFAFSLVFSSGIGIVALGGLAGGNLPGFISRSLSVSAVSGSRNALLAACAIVLVGILPLRRLSLAAKSGSAVREPMRLPAFLSRFLPAIAIWSLVTGAFSPFANLYFVHHLQMSLPRTGLVFSISQLSQVAAILISPIVFRKLGLNSGIVGTQIATAVTLATLALVHGALPASIVYILFTAFQWMGEPGMYSLLMAGVPLEERSAASAWNVFVMSSCQAIAAVIAGSAFTRFGYPAVLIATAAFAMLAAYSFWSLLRGPSVEAEITQTASI